ncbi:hypothetical protein J7E79_25945 [Bacillus sp. ISL-40]|nr:hypothetical protein [Bacillus sp. ISL-40]MBT2742682.1 hypothetical protein [Bacillus sp. ISL-77]
MVIKFIPYNLWDFFIFLHSLQKANCDVLGIGRQIKAYHPNIWKSINWRKDFPEMSIEPNFDVQILNSEE